MADLLPVPSGLPELTEGVGGVHERDLDVVEGIGLDVLNITAAVSLGIQVGQDAIRQVLLGGAGPLGERKR